MPNNLRSSWHELTFTDLDVNSKGMAEHNMIGSAQSSRQDVMDRMTVMMLVGREWMSGRDGWTMRYPAPWLELV